MNKTYKGFITSLKEGEVFVFGANKIGYNGNRANGTGGAALCANLNGWCGEREIMDNRLSNCGKSYGLTTVTEPGKRKSLSGTEITANIKKLYDFARLRTNLTFYIAYTHSGKEQPNLNGYTNRDMAYFFYKAGKIPNNIVFEVNFNKLIEANDGFDEYHICFGTF